MHTEEEARKKWCPFARLTLSDAGTQVAWNRIVDSSDTMTHRQCNCIASECMAWRWNSPQRAILKAAMIPTPQYSITLADAIKNGGEYTVIPNSGNGYCSLAGRP